MVKIISLQHINTRCISKFKKVYLVRNYMNNELAIPFFESYIERSMEVNFWNFSFLMEILFMLFTEPLSFFSIFIQNAVGIGQCFSSVWKHDP